MMVKTGWNTDFGKEKFDVGLGEEDLTRILVDADIPPDAQLTPSEAFRVLYLSAEYYSETVKYSRLQDEQARQSANKAKVAVDVLIAKIKARLGVE